MGAVTLGRDLLIQAMVQNWLQTGRNALGPDAVMDRERMAVHRPGDDGDAQRRPQFPGLILSIKSSQQHSIRGLY